MTTFRKIMLALICMAIAVINVNAEETDKKKPKQIEMITNVRPIPDRPMASVLNCPTPKYPVEAEIYELQGPVILRFMIGEDGKVKQVKVAKSSGWKILDSAAIQPLADCQFEKFEPNGVPTSYWTNVRYVWKMDENALGTKPALLPETCQSSSDLSFAGENEARSDIRLRFRVTNKGKPFGIKVENTSGNVEADLEAMKLLESCQFSPSIYKGKPAEGASSVRVFWEKNKQAREILRTDEALSSFREKYVGKPGHKAFAQSESGVWTWFSDAENMGKAKQSALDGCNSRVKPGEKPCEVVNLDGEWQVKANGNN